MPHSIEHFLPHILQKQSALNETIQAPLFDSRAVLLLSRHVDSVFFGGREAMIMSFFGAFWIFTGPSDILGFFSTEDEAVEFALGCSAETRGATSSS